MIQLISISYTITIKIINVTKLSSNAVNIVNIILKSKGFKQIIVFK